MWPLFVLIATDEPITAMMQKSLTTISRTISKKKNYNSASNTSMVGRSAGVQVKVTKRERAPNVFPHAPGAVGSPPRIQQEKL